MLSDNIFGFLCAILLIKGHFAADSNYKRKPQCPYLPDRAAGQSPSKQNAGDAQCSPPPKKCDPNDIYYSMDGSCNNLDIPSWGQVKTAFVPLLEANYSDGISKFRTSVDGSALPLARDLRLELLPNKYIPSKRLNIWYYGFGQFIDHDVALSNQINSSVQCCVNNKPAPKMPEDKCLPLKFRKDDPFYKKYGVQCLDFKRIINTQTQGCKIKPIYQINSQTAFLDLSITYGTNDADSRKLREGKGGLLKVTKDRTTNNQEYPHIISKSQRCPVGGVDREAGGKCFMTGDQRVNQNPEICMSGTVWMRWHNYMAKELKSVNPKWSDEKLYKEARRINIATYQHVISAEYIPLLLGTKVASLYKLTPATCGYVAGYDRNLNPQTLSSYTAAAGRAGHSEVVGRVKYTGPNGKPDSYLLRNKYFNQSFLLDKNMFSNILQAYIEQPAHRLDQFSTQEITDWMFYDLDTEFGFDLRAMDLLRGLDFGLQPYNKYREACGLCKLKKFEDLKDEIRRPESNHSSSGKYTITECKVCSMRRSQGLQSHEDVETLKSMYKSVDDIDLYIGGLLEKALAGGLLGQTFACIQAESFYRWKFGDRLWYEFSSAGFKSAQLNSIRKTTTMSRIICSTNPSMKSIQKNAFLMEGSQNPQVQCEDLPEINWKLWKDY